MSIRLQDLKTWTNLTCLVCGFRFPPRRFIRDALDTIRSPAQIVTGGGRGKGFHVVRYIPWSDVATLKEQPDVWRALYSEHIRLASAFDNFHLYLGFLSPRMRQIIDSLDSEIFRLRAKCQELQDCLDRLLVTYSRRGESVGEFRRILEEINRRDREDRKSRLGIIK
jgi:hypothetical protein